MLLRNKKVSPIFDAKGLQDPIRDEIFSAERLEQYAEFLASELPFSMEKKRGRSLLPRVKENHYYLKASYQKLTQFASQDVILSPASEWIIDNFHIIEDQVREIKEDLPEKYYLELPKVSKGDLEGYPRVYAIALTLVAHLDSQINIDIIKSFVETYQKTSPLLIGEIWAIPIALRIALIENLRRLAYQAVTCQEIKQKTDTIADQFLKDIESNEDELERLTKSLRKLLGQSRECDCSTISQISQRLHARTPEILPACEYIDVYLAKKDLSIEEVVRIEHQHQAEAQTSISNAITSMRMLSNTDWHDFFESLSLVDKILTKDPIDTYRDMLFKSRDSYRHVIERLHKKTGHGEIEIAEEAVSLAKEAFNKNLEDTDLHHVGYYLIRKGVRKLEKKVGYRPTVSEQIRRTILDYPSHFYLGLLTTFTLLLLVPLMAYAYLTGQHILWSLIIGIVAFIPVSDSALNIINLLVTYFVGPYILPKIDLEKGIPNNAKTFVVVPTIIGSRNEVQKLLEDLEIRFLANQDKNLFFALLTDFTDADTETLETDISLIEYLENGIENLNIKYSDTHNIFYVFHRKRLWNPKEMKWMGWERKRGKLQEFNQFLRGNENLSFIMSPPYSTFFSEVKYVITLDSDTKLPRNSAKKLIGTIIHPLNCPKFDNTTKTVTKGYSILQPRISITPESSGKSLFAKIFSGHTGIDPYTTAVSDSYQDLFGEGIFTGKGLYTVDTFESSLKDRIPENTILSHDLFEGVFARTALVSDIEFLDDYPSHYESFSKRSHRWIRGDWQILKWIFKKIPDYKNNLVTSPLSLISRWKIFDNLRRSLVNPMILLWLILSWSFLPGHSLLWTIIILTVMALPIYAHTASKLFKYPRQLSFLEHTLGIYDDFKMSVSQLFVTILTLPYQTYMHMDAIVRTLYRVYISKKDLLQWTTAAEVESKIKDGKSFTIKMFQFSLVYCFGVLLLVTFIKPYALFTSAIFLGTWFISPHILNKLSQTRKSETFEVEEDEGKVFRNIACRTWNFFETFVTEENNWLPPDNFQQVPLPLIANRTSPTNMGLYLLSCCSAYNFGYIGPNELVYRLDQTLSSMLKLSKEHGHYYNWYNTTSLEPLHPQYISTVDSGNLAGHLLAVKQTCLDLLEQTVKKLDFSTWILGIEDILELMIQESLNLDPALTNLSTSKFKDFNSDIKEMLLILHNENMKTPDLELLKKLKQKANLIEQKLDGLTLHHDQTIYESIILWTKKLQYKIGKFQKELIDLQDKSLMSNTQKKIKEISNLCNKLAYEMDFSVLYDKQRKLFTIGYNVSEGRNDESYYDLLASEARLASLISIAKGDIPEEHWFHLGRQVTSLFNHRVLVSWSASMFEYLMPLLVMKDYFGTLLHETHRSVVKQQIAYGAQRNLPWGVSESAYNARDLNMNYQYSPFGVPGMGLKRGLSQDFVISPYSTALATLVLPKEALKNFKALIKSNFLTNYGFFEAIDYTKERIPPKQSFSIVRNFMAHHQGMTLVALDNVLHQNIIRERFHKDPIIKSTELLLQERIPQRVSILHPRPEEVSYKKMGDHEVTSSLEHINKVNTESPRVRVISNSHYTTMITSSGSGFSKCEGDTVFRWSEDPTLENGGQYFFISDDTDGKISSLTFSPINKNPENYSATFSAHKAEFWFKKNDLSAHKEVIVSAEDNVELRRITLTNTSDREISFELSSYTEPVLSPIDADIAHPAFNKLFLETEYISEKTALLAKRKKKQAEDNIYGIHQIIFDDKVCTNLQYETNRLKFLGRGNTWEKAQALKNGKELSNSLGRVLDPILSFKTKIKLKPHETTKILFVGGLARSRDEALRILDQYHNIKIFDREEKMSWTQNQVSLRHLNLEVDEVNTFQKIAASILFSSPCLRAAPNLIKKNRKNQTALWSYGISGDIPILLVTIKNKHSIKFIQDTLQLHEYLREKNIQFDLVILSDEASSYKMAIHEELLQQIRVFRGHGLLNKRAGIFLLRTDLISEEDELLLKAVSNVYFDAHQGPLKKQVNNLLFFKPRLLPEVNKLSRPLTWKDFSIQRPKLELDNGYGGFKDDGKEYQIFLEATENTPAPWINVISNPKGFGFTISESGSGYTWSQNSRENRLTPWNNDPVLDPSGEILYLRDNKTQESWSPTPVPIRNELPYLIRHGQGYTIFEHKSFELAQSVTMYVSMDEEIKYIRLKVKNLGSIKRNISAYLYLKWVIGFHRSKTLHHVITEKDGDFYLAHNPFLLDFSQRMTFATTNKKVASFTCDRRSFLGRLRSYQTPRGLSSTNLDGKIGAGLDPCLVLKTDLELEAGQEDEVIFMMGQTDKSLFNKELLSEYVQKERADQELKQVKEYWDETLNTIQIKTPYPEFDVLMNRWMLYQTMSSRIWARTAFYQSGGAYGFRDQLQDISSLVHTRPKFAREHILRAAAHQFPEGDVLHWWHPPMDKGVRTRFADDLLWLPFIVDYYIKASGDESIFDEQISFVEGPLLTEGLDDLYIETKRSKNKASLYEHCILTLDYSLSLGKHGLPHIGSGDWNDGMNRVGNKGKGESIWMAWFLGSNLKNFIEICDKRGEHERSQKYKDHLEKIKAAVETTGWDGQWYRRAYFDDGTPLGSKENDECQIDSIAQSWSVLSGLGDQEHKKTALSSAKDKLINEEDKIIHLFTPPFDKTPLDPGYIKEYPMGVRENGGQYTHAAIWFAMALAEHGDSDTAFKVMNYINPINHSRNKEEAAIYMIEPYVITADIYSHPQHIGRGGWSWYTGSSSWFYRAFIESILGIYRKDKQLIIKPSLPNEMDRYEVNYTFGKSVYHIIVEKSESANLKIDGEIIKYDNEIIIPLIDDSKTHTVELSF